MVTDVNIPTNPSLLDTFVGVEGIELTVIGRTFARGVGLEQIQAGDAEPTGFVASSDGRSVQTLWHDEADGGAQGAAYFERFEHGARVAHGWVDSVSRRIVQTG